MYLAMPSKRQSSMCCSWKIYHEGRVVKRKHLRDIKLFPTWRIAFVAIPSLSLFLVTSNRFFVSHLKKTKQQKADYTLLSWSHFSTVMQLTQSWKQFQTLLATKHDNSRLAERKKSGFSSHFLWRHQNGFFFSVRPSGLKSLRRCDLAIGTELRTSSRCRAPRPDSSAQSQAIQQQIIQPKTQPCPSLTISEFQNSEPCKLCNFSVSKGFYVGWGRPLEGSLAPSSLMMAACHL